MNNKLQFKYDLETYIRKNGTKFYEKKKIKIEKIITQILNNIDSFFYANGYDENWEFRKIVFLSSLEEKQILLLSEFIAQRNDYEFLGGITISNSDSFPTYSLTLIKK